MSIFYPKFDYKSVREIPFEDLKKQGIKAIFFDIDNTLTTHGTSASKKDLEFFEYLRDLGFDTVLMSNNKEKRVKPYADFVKSKYIAKSNKPFKKSYEKALSLVGLDAKEVVFVGDQVFTDVLGANLFGITSILVEPIAKAEELQIVLKRSIEKFVLYFYHKKKGK